MTEVPATIVEQNGIAGADTVSRATVSSEAVLHATIKALKSGIK